MTEEKHWSKFQERGSYWGIRVLLFAYRILGRYGIFIFLFPIVLYFYATGGASRRASLDFHRRVQKILDSKVKVNHWTGIRHFLKFSSAAFDKIDAWIGRIDNTDLLYTNYENFEKLIDAKRGAIFIGSHLGNLEVCRALSKGKYKVKINVLVFTHHAVEFNKVLNMVNSDAGVNIIQVNHIGPAVAILLHEKIERGEILVIVGDRTSVTSEGRVSYVDFLGSPAPFPHGPFILAALMDCPVYMLFCLKEKKEHRIIFEYLSDNFILPRKQRRQGLQKIIEEYAARLSYYAVKYPFQWFNFFDFWQQDDKVKR